MCIQIAQRSRRKFHGENKKKTFLSSMRKKMFFDNPTRKAITTCKISTFFEDLSFLNFRSHLNDMDLHMSSHGTIRTKGPCCAFYTTKHQVC